MIINTTDPSAIKSFLKKLYIPPKNSHKGQNGKVLIIGGSRLFHSASLWAAEVATHFNDMVHYASTKENNAIFHELKTVFRNGIVVEQKDIPYYMAEDDAILLGPGMVRHEITNEELRITNYEEVLAIENESQFTRAIASYTLHHYPDKRFVFDAGTLQMMNPEWLKSLREKAIITPHQLEFERLFKTPITNLSEEEKIKTVQQYAKEYNVVILLKAVQDIISDGDEVILVEGGNPGLTKGGSGDILAGLTLSLRAKNDALVSAVVASFVEKTAADALSETKGYWFNMEDLIEQIPKTFNILITN